ncbi:uncharacterized protein LOC114951217 [Acropora millepora]|uniref:uncharacterized protein LOC114951217 n=1 Tax=Acropora millepora TaxID=45264 RepID=UPI001CF34CEF|nr:uncharacterized protein LOC114951217 [Acropora millepora]
MRMSEVTSRSYNYEGSPSDIGESRRFSRPTRREFQSRTFKGSPSEMEVAPFEIYLRGPRALEAYYKALEEGETRVRRIPLMLIGQARSGKTSLKKSLKGIPFNPHEDSTVGVDVDPSYFKVTTETWKIGKEDQVTDKEAKSYFEYNLGRQVVKNLKHDENQPKTDSEEQSVSERNEVTEDSPSQMFAHGASSMHSVARTLSKTEKDGNHTFETTDDKWYPEQTTERDDALSPQKTLKDIESLLPDLLAVDQVEGEDDIYSLLWDFAGESVYYETHILFLTSRAIFLLTYDLSRDPYEKALPVKKQEMFKVVEDRIGTKTNLDYLDYWMTSVSLVSSQGKDHEVNQASASTVLPKTLPPVFLVCTHADQPYDGKDPRDLALEVYGELQEKSYSTHLCGKFEVDNTKSGEKPECPGVSRLRESIRAVAKELPQMKEFIPIKWLKFEKMLQVFLNNGHKWISIERAKKIAYDFCQIHSDVAFKTAIDFLHDQRILIHFDNTTELNKLVILDLQWLIDVMKKVITIKRYDDGEGEFKFLWRKLEKEGILEEKLLQHVWGPLTGEAATFESLIAIMEKFSLLCSWPASDGLSSRKYLVPSMLKSHPPEHITKLIVSARLPSLFIKFESGQVPSRLFPRLVTQFLLWGKDEFWSSVNPQLYQNFARLFTAKDDKCSVVLFCHSSSIEVVVHGGNGSYEVSCAQSVFKQLLLMLECMRKEFFWLESMRYLAGVVCTICCRGRKVEFCHTHGKNDCEREECLHFISESELRSANEFITCTRSPTALNNKVCIKDFSAWLNSSQKTTLHGVGERLAAVSSGRDGEENSAALPRDVVQLLESRSCAPEEIVLQWMQNLNLDKTCLEQPTAETTRMMRCFSAEAKISKRSDVVKHLRDIAPAGTTGPLLQGDLDVDNIPQEQIRELTINLSGGEDWKVVAERMGFTAPEIPFLDHRTRNPFEAALAHYIDRNPMKVDDLYDILTECGMPVLADIL